MLCTTLFHSSLHSGKSRQPLCWIQNDFDWKSIATYTSSSTATAGGAKTQSAFLHSGHFKIFLSLRIEMLLKTVCESFSRWSYRACLYPRVDQVFIIGAPHSLRAQCGNLLSLDPRPSCEACPPFKMRAPPVRIQPGENGSTWQPGPNSVVDVPNLYFWHSFLSQKTNHTKTVTWTPQETKSQYLQKREIMIDVVEVFIVFEYLHTLRGGGNFINIV